MYKIVLSLRIKYDDSRNIKKCAERTTSIVGFDSTKDHNSYLCLVCFSFLIDAIRYIIYFESEKKNYEKKVKVIVL